MANLDFSSKQKMATLLGINNLFNINECLVAQGDIKNIGKTVESLVIKFDQKKFEEYLFSRSESPRLPVNTGVSPPGSAPPERVLMTHT